MNKVKDSAAEENASLPDLHGTWSQKKHKKHKHKKHKKKKISLDEECFVTDNIEDKSPFKVKLKKEEDKILEKPKIMKTQFPNVINVNTLTSPKSAIKKKIPKGSKSSKRDSGTSSEEERWLDAIESGKLEEVDDELKKIKPKDPKLMTARQRAMLERKTDMEPNPEVEQLISLPTGYKEKKMTAEAIQKAIQKSEKRRKLAEEKREKDKKKTMERLLKKSESKASKVVGKGKILKRQIPIVTYRLTVDGSSISMPPGEEFPLASSVAKILPPPSTCGIQNCTKLKKYSCSRTGIPLCSLECYKKNLSSIFG